jgi:hypothetical protein
VAKKKPRTPQPPRKVQAPQQRQAQRQPMDRRNILFAVVGLGVAGLVAALIVVFASGGSTKDASSGSDASVRKAMTAAGCTYVSKAPLPPKKDVPSGYHLDVPTLTTKVKWSTFPPSAGSHYPLWAVWGFYTQAVNPRQVVHNLEHGGVVLWWGPKVPESTVSQLRDFYNGSPTGMVGTPIAGLGNKVAISAWTGDPSRYYEDGYHGTGHVAVCPGFDKVAFTAFRDAFRGHGPEGTPMEANQEGSGP